VGYYYYQFGMAPGATLASAAIATDWVGHDGQFDISTQSLVYAYKTTMQTGIPFEILPGLTLTIPANVINSSWGFDDPAGTAQETKIIDALAFANHQTVTLAAGNHNGPGAAPVIGPASGFNTIAVGALTGDLTTPPYNQPAPFTNFGPNDFFLPDSHGGGQTIPGVRAAVDIAAPGTDLILPAYTGTTGSDPFNGVDPYPSQTNLYFFGLAGTSFASPTVGGGAALLVDAGYANFGGGTSIDGRVIKAVLLNSARKTPGWTNNPMLISGVNTTVQGLDWTVGAGALDLNAAYDQYLSGNTDLPGLGGGTIHREGWDFGLVTPGSPNDYHFVDLLHGGDIFAATLTWFVDRSLDAATNEARDVSFDDLNLQVWSVQNGMLSRLIAQSDSVYNNTEELYFRLPGDGCYALRVLWYQNLYDLGGNPFSGNAQGDNYALAWNVFAQPLPDPNASLLTPPFIPPPPPIPDVPEPSPVVLALMALAGLAVRVMMRRERGTRVWG
jgi:hypothetical protein